MRQVMVIKCQDLERSKRNTYQYGVDPKRTLDQIQKNMYNGWNRIRIELKEVQ